MAYQPSVLFYKTFACVLEYPYSVHCHLNMSFNNRRWSIIFLHNFSSVQSFLFFLSHSSTISYQPLMKKKFPFIVLLAIILFLYLFLSMKNQYPELFISIFLTLSYMCCNFHIFIICYHKLWMKRTKTDLSF